MQRLDFSESTCSVVAVLNMAMRATLMTSFSTLVLLACSFAESGTAADRAAARFHELYNEAQYSTIYKEASPEFQSQGSESRLIQLLDAVQRKIGRVRGTQRDRLSVFATTEGTTITATYVTQFERGRATETFRLALVGSEARLVGYNINSADLIITN